MDKIASNLMRFPSEIKPDKSNRTQGKEIQDGNKPCMDFRMLPANVQFQGNEIDKMENKQWKTRDCYLHGFTETCLHYNIRICRYICWV